MTWQDLTTFISRLLTATAITGLSMAAHSLPFKAQDNVGSNQKSIYIENSQLEEIVTTAKGSIKKSYKAKSNIYECMFRC